MLILADDLTGAADSAAAFVGRGHTATVVLAADESRHTDQNTGQHPDQDKVDASVVSIDTDSRRMTIEEATSATRDAMNPYLDMLAEGRPVLVKIDSTMRGHVRSTVETVLATLPRRPSRVVVCPAFPALGRTVIDGIVHVDGEPFDGGVLRELFSGFPAGAGLFLAAAQTDEHLAALVRSMDDNVLWVGSAGLAAHLAERFAPPTSARVDGTDPVSAGRQQSSSVVVVVGSQHEHSIEQLAILDAAGPTKGVRILRLDPRDRSFLSQARSTLVAADGLVLTGGQTARAVLDLLTVTRLDIHGEVETGMPWSTTSAADGRTITVITKAGGFGDPSSLQRAVSFLTEPYLAR